MATNVTKSRILATGHFFSELRPMQTSKSPMAGNDRGTVGRSDEDTEDVRLMQLVAEGDTSAFEQLIERHQALVAGTVARMLGSNSDVEDIAQQVFTLLETELQRAIEEAIMQLPESQRMALVLRRYEQLSYEQIAEVLDLSVPAVKSVLFRARTELRTRLSKYLA